VPNEGEHRLEELDKETAQEINLLIQLREALDLPRQLRSTELHLGEIGTKMGIDLTNEQTLHFTRRALEDGIQTLESLRKALANQPNKTDKLEKAIARRNYENFHHLPIHSSTDEQVKESSAGVEGWKSYKSVELERALHSTTELLYESIHKGNEMKELLEESEIRYSNLYEKWSHMKYDAEKGTIKKIEKEITMVIQALKSVSYSETCGCLIDIACIEPESVTELIKQINGCRRNPNPSPQGNYLVKEVTDLQKRYYFPHSAMQPATSKIGQARIYRQLSNLEITIKGTRMRISSNINSTALLWTIFNQLTHKSLEDIPKPDTLTAPHASRARYTFEIYDSKPNFELHPYWDTTMPLPNEGPILLSLSNNYCRTRYHGTQVILHTKMEKWISPPHHELVHVPAYIEREPMRKEDLRREEPGKSKEHRYCDRYTNHRKPKRKEKPSPPHNVKKEDTSTTSPASKHVKIQGSTTRLKYETY
jgi:hypothetical protein